MSSLTVANQLTLFRLLLVPALVLLVLYGFNGWAFLAFAVAGITDALDGLIARRTGQRTRLGALLDPMADKLLLASTFVVLTMPLGLPNQFPLWFTITVISRDVLIVVTVAVINLAVERRIFYPSLWGKIATLCYVATAGMALFFNYLDRSSTLLQVGIYASLLLTVVSGLHYIVHATRIVNDS